MKLLVHLLHFSPFVTDIITTVKRQDCLFYKNFEGVVCEKCRIKPRYSLTVPILVNWLIIKHLRITF